MDRTSCSQEEALDIVEERPWNLSLRVTRPPGMQAVHCIAETQADGVIGGPRS